MKPALSSELCEDLLNDFYLESDEHLKNIRGALVLLEQSVGKAQADRAIVDELFRSFHSFKGNSGIIGLRAAEELAHASEDYLRELTRGRVSLTPQALELLMSAVQKLEQIVAAFSSHGAAPDSGSLMDALRALTDQEPPTGKDGERQPCSDSDATEANETENAVELGLLLWRCTFVPTRELDQRGVNINAVRARLSQVGTILHA